MFYRSIVKRLIDLLAAIVALLLLWPVILVTAILLYFFNDGGVLFKQTRPGFKGKPFTIYKFKTMNDRRDANGELLPDGDRITPVGSFLRKTSLDELPQLFNVLIGNLSLVGPRPLLMEYLPHYNAEQARRHDVKPGITGWAQINGRNAITWPEKFKLDVYYVDHQSLWLDIKILVLTLLKVVNRQDVNASENVTMEKFTGNP